MSRQRTRVKLEDDDQGIDLSGFEADSGNEDKGVSKSEIASVSENAGFTSREVTTQRPRRRRGKKSPFTAQMSIRVRPEIKALFQDMAERLDLADNSAFEMAVSVWVSAHGTPEERQRLNQILSE